MSQKQAILRMLQERPEGITALDALEEARCFRLAARISDIKDEGFHVESTLERTPTGKYVARYRLMEPTLWS